MLLTRKFFTRNESLKLDKSVYVELDEGDWRVFGDNTGFCYFSGSTKSEAETFSANLNQNLKDRQNNDNSN